MAGATQAFIAPARVLLTPSRTFASISARHRWLWVVCGLAVLTAATAAALVPAMTSTMQAAVSTPLAETYVRRVAWISATVLAPLGALAQAAVLALIAWTIPLFAARQTSLAGCLVVMGTALGIQSVERLVILAVVTLRAANGDVSDMATVRTGFDMLWQAPANAPGLGWLLEQIGPFKIWLVALVAIGLRIVEGLTRKLAIATACIAVGTVDFVLWLMFISTR